jgi:hypothetical protein
MTSSLDNDNIVGHQKGRGGGRRRGRRGRGEDGGGGKATEGGGRGNGGSFDEKVMNDLRKMFQNFFLRNLRMGQISQSVCPCQVFAPESNIRG